MICVLLIYDNIRYGFIFNGAVHIDMSLCRLIIISPTTFCRTDPFPLLRISLSPHNATSCQHNMWYLIQLLMTLYVVSSPDSGCMRRGGKQRYDYFQRGTPPESCDIPESRI